MTPVHLALVLHSHQPVGNFEHVQEQVYGLAYLPFIAELERHPGIRVGLHYSGILLEWLEARHPEYLERVASLVEAGRAEMLGGGYYEPILSAIPDRDRVAQIEKLSQYIERRFGKQPAGIWLAERVWDPSMPQTLARAGVKYTLTDDYHFLSVGLEEEELYGYYLTEWQGSAVKVIPGQKRLRYLLPFRMEHEAIGYLRGIAERGQGGLVAMGDDLEKFGAWPQTHEHVYGQGWLRRFFEALEEASGWVTTTLPAQYLEAHPPLGRIYLPTASYQEMMGWALPAGSELHYEELVRQLESRDGRLARFAHGGLWLNFFRKYEEANQLHKRMLDISKRYEELDGAAGRASELCRRGYDSLLRSQCNDSYWHGVFGGLYAPHLRTAVYQALLEAEEAAETLRPRPPEARRGDLNLDGREEILLFSESLRMMVMTGDGGTAGEIAYRPRSFNVINSLRRRPEAYHGRLRDAAAQGGGAESIHDRVVSKEPNLDRYLQYDRYNRHALRSLVFAAGRTVEDYRLGQLEEDGALAGGPYEVVSVGPDCCHLRGRSPSGLEVENRLTLSGASLTARWTLSSGGQKDLRGGLELVLNLLAPEAHDRYFLLPGPPEKASLSWSGEVEGKRIWLVDEWLNLRIQVRVEPAAAWWIAPIFTVSQSEEGFEKVYQGSCLLPHWAVGEDGLEAMVRVEIGAASGGS